LDSGAGEKRFDTVCGTHHEALADALGCAMILFDEEGFLRSSLPLCKLFDLSHSRLVYRKDKLSSPVIHEAIHKPWHEYPDQTVGGCGEQSDIRHQFGNLTPGPSTALSRKPLAMMKATLLVRPYVSLIYKTFRFFFRMLLLMRVVDATNYYRYVTKQVKNTGKTEPDQRCSKCKSLSVGELLVFIGIMVLMGACPRERGTHIIG
jgi:hypothetical protein